MTSFFRVQYKDLLDKMQRAIDQPAYLEEEELEITERVVNLVPKPFGKLTEIHQVRTPDLVKRRTTDGRWGRRYAPAPLGKCKEHITLTSKPRPPIPQEGKGFIFHNLPTQFGSREITALLNPSFHHE